MKEASLTKKIRIKLKEKFGGCFYKIPGGPHMVVGFPDLVGVIDGYMIAIEVKLPGKEGNLTARQEYVIKELSETGKCLAFVTSSAEDAILKVGEYLRLKNAVK